MTKSEKRNRFIDLLVMLVCACLELGITFLFHACGPKDDGSFMACHWAQRAVQGVAFVLVVQAFVENMLKNRDMKRGILIAMIPTALTEILIPGGWISLCMMKSMRCHTVMRPAVTVLAIVIVVLVVVDFLLWSRMDEEKKDE